MWFNQTSNFVTATISARDAQRDVFRALTQEPTWASDMHASGAELIDVVARMFAVAQMCARAGRQSEACCLLRLARDKQQSRRDTSSSRAVRSAAAIEVHRAARCLEGNEESEDLWRIEIMQQLLEQNAPEPWPATLVAMCTPKDKDNPQGCVDAEGVVRAFCMLAKKRYLATRLTHRDEVFEWMSSDRDEGDDGYGRWQRRRLREGDLREEYGRVNPLPGDGLITRG